MTEQQRKAMEAALSFIMVSSAKDKAWYTAEEFELVSALRQALAQPEQEPVVGMFEEKLPDQNPPPWVRDYKPKREWVGLTDDEIKEIVGPWGDTPIKGYTRKLFDQIEAKLKEKNGG